MHLLKHRDRPAKPLIPCVSEHWRREPPRLRGRRYNGRGEFMHETGPKRDPDKAHQRNLRTALAEVASKPMPEEWRPFDVEGFTPLAGRMLLRRPEPVKELNGVMLAEKDWIYRPDFILVRAGDGVDFAPGTRLVFAKKSKPKVLHLEGVGQHYLGRATAVVAVVE